MSELQELRVVDTPIYDDMIIAVMDDHEDDQPRCAVDGRPASCRTMCTRCHTQKLACPKCEAVILALMRRHDSVAECAHCHQFGPSADMIRVVPL